MPELPEVESLARFLAEQSGGRTIEKVELAAIAALKTFDPPLDALVGRTVVGADRRGKFLGLDTDGMWLALHLARGGWVRWSDSLSPGPVKRGKGPLALRVRFEGGAGFDVTEAGTEKRLAVYVVRSLDEVPGIARLGPDVLDPSFDAAALGKVLAEHGSQQVKGVLTEQVAIAGVGNAYSDEALFVAKLSPFRQAGKLSADEVERLWAALRLVLTEAVERSLGLPAAGLKSEKKSGMRVHGRTGQPCPVCGDTVREVSFATKSLQYCPTCQTGGKPLADRRLSRLLK
ncbi:MAG TPA: DNA-formamidopyrimidine glycosylase family protein [Acidimicrobiales bacterium]|nr:DNA-formamidopyrimidine glycosylase family protein [Acidimicrobiales bacterium]